MKMALVNLGLLSLFLSFALRSAQPTRDTNVQLWFCNNPATQSWDLNTTSTRIALAATPFVWDIDGPSNKTGALIHLFTVYKTLSQLYNYTADFQFESLYAPGMCVTASTPLIAGVPLSLQPCTKGGSIAQTFAYNSSTRTLILASNPTLCVDAGSSTNCSMPPQSSFPFCNHLLPPETRAADLVSRLTVPEIAQLLSNKNIGIPRLGVPALHYGEALHGYVTSCITNPAPGTTGCPTSFPHALLMGGAFNRTLWHAVATVISTEGRAIFNAVNRSSRK